MPTNSNYDGYFQGIGQVPLFTYGMIAVTTIVLGYMTWMDTGIEEEVPVVEETALIPETPADLTPPEGLLSPVPEPIQEPLVEAQPEEPLVEAQSEEPIVEAQSQELTGIQQKQQGGKRIRKTKRRRPE